MSLDSIDNETRYFVKTQEELNAKSEELFNEAGLNTEDGSITTLFANIINYNISNLYSALKTFHLNQFLSTASGTYLEDMAAKKSLTRNTDESDASLRNRISLADRVNATGNHYSLSNIVNVVPEITSVIEEPFVQGAGSFEIILRTSTPTQEVYDKSVAYIKAMSPVGTKYFVNYPNYITVKFKIKVNTHNATLSDKTDVEKNVIANVAEYMSNIMPDATLEKNELLYVIKNSDPKITSSSIIECTIDGKVINFQQITLKYNEQFALSSDSILILD
jgi:uncharacterized phage protein gp47/JayE